MKNLITVMQYRIYSTEIFLVNLLSKIKIIKLENVIVNGL